MHAAHPDAMPPKDAATLKQEREERKRQRDAHNAKTASRRSRTSAVARWLLQVSLPNAEAERIIRAVAEAWADRGGVSENAALALAGCDDAVSGGRCLRILAHAGMIDIDPSGLIEPIVGAKVSTAEWREASLAVAGRPAVRRFGR